MTDVEKIGYESAPHALDDLMSLSRMLELARAIQTRTEAMNTDMVNLVNHLVAERRKAVKAIDALTETAPPRGLPYVEATGARMAQEVSAMEIEVMGIIARCGGLP